MAILVDTVYSTPHAVPRKPDAVPAGTAPTAAAAAGVGALCLRPGLFRSPLRDKLSAGRRHTFVPTVVNVSIYPCFSMIIYGCE